MHDLDGMYLIFDRKLRDFVCQLENCELRGFCGTCFFQLCCQVVTAICQHLIFMYETPLKKMFFFFFRSLFKPFVIQVYMT